MANCANASVGARPLDDLGPREYGGRQGGLYPGGSNVRPAAHDAAGRSIAATIQPLDANGAPNANGKIGLVALGFSTTKRTFDQFKALAAADAAVSTKVKAATCAVSGRGAQALANPTHAYWTQEVPSLLAAAGLAKEQVQIAWLLTGQLVKEEDWPDHVDTLEANVVKAIQNARAFFPNLQLCYLSSFNYLGYALPPPDTQAAQEPHYFEQGFAFKDVIERQLNQDAELNFDPAAGVVKAPWLSWGGYCWCDGAMPRADGLEWNCPSDVIADGIHAAPTVGGVKLGSRLLEFFKGDQVAAPWFLASAATACGAPARATIVGDGIAGTTGLPLLAMNRLPVKGTAAPKLLLALARPGATALFMLGTRNDTPFAGGTLYVNPIGWTTTTRTVGPDGRAEWILPDVPAEACGMTTCAQVAIVDDAATHGWALTEGLELAVGD